MDTAQTLFYQKGYENTSVNFIIETIGISKGTFYHYFKSKTEMLRALSEHNNSRRIEEMKPVFEDESLPALVKLNRWFNSAEDWKKENFETFLDVSRIIYLDENIQLRIAMADARIRISLPWITKIIEQGVAEGVFDTKFPRETAEMFLWVSNGFGEITSKLLGQLKERPENRELIERHIEVFFASLDSLLGAPEGSDERPSKKYCEMLYEVFSE